MRSLILVPLVVLVAACGGGSPTSSSPSTAAPASPAASATASAAAGQGQVVAITESEFKIDPASVTVKAGSVTFQLANHGQALHDLHIAPHGSTAEIGASQRISAGGSTSLTVTLQPGTYDMWCGVPGHRQAGMAGTITVT